MLDKILKREINYPAIEIDNDNKILSLGAYDNNGEYYHIKKCNFGDDILAEKENINKLNKYIDIMYHLAYYLESFGDSNPRVLEKDVHYLNELNLLDREFVLSNVNKMREESSSSEYDDQLLDLKYSLDFNLIYTEDWSDLIEFTENIYNNMFNEIYKNRCLHISHESYIYLFLNSIDLEEDQNIDDEIKYSSLAEEYLNYENLNFELFSRTIEFSSKRRDLFDDISKGNINVTFDTQYIKNKAIEKIMEELAESPSSYNARSINIYKLIEIICNAPVKFKDELKNYEIEIIRD